MCYNSLNGFIFICRNVHNERVYDYYTRECRRKVYTDFAAKTDRCVTCIIYSFLSTSNVMSISRHNQSDDVRLYHLRSLRGRAVV